MEFSHYIFNYFCSFLVHFLSYLSLKQFTKCIFCRLVLQFPAALIVKDWKQQGGNLEGVQRCCKELCTFCSCPNNSVFMKWWEPHGPLKLGLGGKVRSFCPLQAQSIFHGLGLLNPVPWKDMSLDWFWCLLVWVCGSQFRLIIFQVSCLQSESLVLLTFPMWNWKQLYSLNKLVGMDKKFVNSVVNLLARECEPHSTGAL